MSVWPRQQIAPEEAARGGRAGRKGSWVVEKLVRPDEFADQFDLCGYQFFTCADDVVLARPAEDVDALWVETVVACDVALDLIGLVEAS